MKEYQFGLSVTFNKLIEVAVKSTTHILYAKDFLDNSDIADERLKDFLLKENIEDSKDNEIRQFPVGAGPKDLRP